METTYDDISRTAELSGGQTIYAFHKSEQCAGEHCPVHNPSDHPYRDLALFFEPEGFYMYRVTDDGTKILDPDEYRLRTSDKVIIRNSVLCRECGTEIESAYRHNYVCCPCGAVAVDGGRHYLKRSAWNMEQTFKDTSIVCTRDNLVIQ